MGSMVMINDNLIGWWCTKQKTVALSSMEAEYIGYCSATRNGMYIAQLLDGITKTNFYPIPLCGDNMAAEIFANKKMTNERTKHIEVALHYTREKIQAGMFTTEHVMSLYETRIYI